jgi:hypothetical protein
MNQFPPSPRVLN